MTSMENLCNILDGPVLNCIFMFALKQSQTLVIFNFILHDTVVVE
jgi:hypothetical protein